MSSIKINNKWKKRWFTIGVFFCILGSIDPLEGSVLIVLGSIILAYIASIEEKRNKNFYKWSSILITVGVVAVFYLSFLGGFGCDTCISWWWIILMIPYPIGWLLLAFIFFKWMFSSLKSKKH